MRTIFAEYNPGSDCALNTLAIDEPLEYARLYLDGNLQMWGRCRRFLDIIVMLNKSSLGNAQELSDCRQRPRHSAEDFSLKEAKSQYFQDF